MIKYVHDRVWAFDLEWVPDPLAGRLLCDVPEDVQDPERILEEMWRAGGASEEDPTPFLKLIRCRVVSIAAVERRVHKGEVKLKLISLPHAPEDPAQTGEARVIGPFLESLGQHQPQIVGFNSQNSDLKILVQRGVVLGLRAAAFCARPNKPWEGVDYFARGSDFNVDIQDMLSGWGKGVPSLHELAVQSGIPGKMDVDGNQVARMWLDGELAKIVAYNEFDALTTYLVWLRLAHFAGHFSGEQYAEEQRLVTDLLEKQGTERPHLRKYLDEWNRLSNIIRTQRG